MGQSEARRPDAVMDDEVFVVRESVCSSCIYRKDSPLDLAKLEAEVIDEYGGVNAYRICHHHRADGNGRGTCCRGFWNCHWMKYAPARLAMRFGLVRFSDEGDFWEEGRHG